MIPNQGDSSKKEVSGKTESFLSSLVEKFKPSNIAKMLTGGVGSMAKKFKSNKDEKTSKVNKKNPYFTSIPSSGMRNVSVNDTLSDAIAKLYSLVKRQNEYDIKKNELEEDFDGQKSMDEEKKHQELIDAFKKLQKKSVKKERVKREPEKKPKETPVDKKVPEAKPAPKESVPKKTSEPVKETPKTPKETPKKSSEPVQQPAPKQPPPKTETPVPKPSAQPVKPPSSGSTVGTMAKAAGTTAIVGGLLMPSQSIGAVIDKAAKTVGVDRGLMYAMANQESHFDPTAKPGTSSAKGIYQFINSTWQEMVKQYGSQFPILKERSAEDPEASAIAGALFIRDNSNALNKAKIPVNATTIYAAHFLGAGGAVKLLSSPGDKDASSILPGPAKSNAYIFYKDKDKSQPRTVDEVVDVLFKKVGQYQEKYTQTLNKMDQGQQLTDASNQYNDNKKEQNSPVTPVVVNNQVINNNIGGNKQTLIATKPNDTPAMLSRNNGK